MRNRNAIVGLLLACAVAGCGSDVNPAPPTASGSTAATGSTPSSSGPSTADALAGLTDLLGSTVDADICGGSGASGACKPCPLGDFDALLGAAHVRSLVARATQPARIDAQAASSDAGASILCKQGGAIFGAFAAPTLGGAATAFADGHITTQTDRDGCVAERAPDDESFVVITQWKPVTGVQPAPCDDGLRATLPTMLAALADG